jgi:general secretion pathway protein H
MTRSRTAGITLIEVLIVVVVIGVATSVVSMGFGAMERTKLRSACNRIMSASRFAYNRAIIRGSTVRIAFDLPAKSISIEEAHGRITLSRADDARRDEGNDGKHEAAVDPWAAAQARVQDTFKPSLGASPFGPLTDNDGRALKKYANLSLGDGVRLVKLIVAHEPVPLEEGPGALYFFPGGRTQHAVIQLADRYDNVFSVEIHPLTGRAKVHAEAYSPDRLLDDDDGRDVTEIDDR